MSRCPQRPEASDFLESQVVVKCLDLGSGNVLRSSLYS